MGRRACAVALALGIVLVALSHGCEARKLSQTVVNLGTNGTASGGTGKGNDSSSGNYTIKPLKIDLDPKEMAQLLKAFFRGTVSNNTAEATTPDNGYSATMSGAISLNPFLSGTALANSLALSGKNATSDAKGMVLGMIGSGRVTSAATALGKDSAQSSVDGMSYNAVGAQQTISSNLAFTAGSSKTSVKSNSLTAAGPSISSGLSNALGVKSASSSGRATSNTGLGISASSIFANALTHGTATSASDATATAILGPSASVGGALATSFNGDSSADSRSKTLSGVGSSTSRSGSTALGRDAADSSSTSNSTSVKGVATSDSATLALGTYASSDAGALAASRNGSARAASASSATGATSAAASSNATAHTTTGRQSSHSSSSSSSGNMHKGLFGFALLPALPSVPAFAAYKGSGVTSLMANALAKTVGLKALLPAVPQIHPGFASEPPPFEAAVAPGNDTAAPACTANCTGDVNSTSGGNNNTMQALAGIFGDLMNKQQDFLKRNSPPPPPGAMEAALKARNATKKSARVIIPVKKASPSPALGGARPAAGAPPRPAVKKPLPLPAQG